MPRIKDTKFCGLGDEDEEEVCRDFRALICDVEAMKPSIQKVNLSCHELRERRPHDQWSYGPYMNRRTPKDIHDEVLREIRNITTAANSLVLDESNDRNECVKTRRRDGIDREEICRDLSSK